MQPFTFQFMINGIMMVIIVTTSVYLGMKLFTMIKELLILVSEELKSEYEPRWPMMYKKKKERNNKDETDC